MGLEQILWGGLVRFLQALSMAAPTILVGLFIAGVFERLFGRENTLRLFGGKGFRSLLVAWLMGMLLPVCSLGVIPILRVMKRSGFAGGTLLAFALAAPIFNPISLLYGLTLARPLVVISFAICALIVVTVVGAIWNRVFPRTDQADEKLPQVAPGLGRISLVGVVALRELAGPSLVYILIGVAGSALLGMMLPHGALQRAMNGDNPWAPLTMAGVSVPVYATPMLAMSQLGSMFQHGNSVGAAYVLLTLGTGLNLGFLAWIVRQYGWKPGLAWFSLILVIVVGLAYAVDRPLYPTDIDPADHTHSFDIYCNPFHAATAVSLQEVREQLSDSVKPPDRIVLGLLGLLLAAGLVLRWRDPHGRLERWLETPPVRKSALDVRVPAPVLGGLALVALVGLSGVGCYIYYPAPADVFEELQAIRAEAFVAANQGNEKQTDHWIALMDEWTRRLEVGVFLRRGRLSEYEHMKARILREKLELLRHEVEEGDKDATREMVKQSITAYERLRKLYAS